MTAGVVSAGLEGNRSSLVAAEDDVDHEGDEDDEITPIVIITITASGSCSR